MSVPLMFLITQMHAYFFFFSFIFAMGEFPGVARASFFEGTAVSTQSKHTV